MASVGLSFLQVLDNPSISSKNLEQNNQVYVHPMVKRSKSALSTKSLEMCTESLGSETGSESGDEFCVISMAERERLRSIQKSKCRSFDRKVRRNDFPPPLTSISGSHGTVNVRHHREDGRLVIKAVSVSNCGTNFQAERINGRLKLSLLRDRFVSYESERVEMVNYESERVEVVNYESERVEMVNYESERVEMEEYEKSFEIEECEESCEVESNEDEEGDETVAVNVTDDEAENGGWRWDIDGNRWRMARKGDLNMLTRCKEGGNENKVFTNWESSWVAIS